MKREEELAKEDECSSTQAPRQLFAQQLCVCVCVCVRLAVNRLQRSRIGSGALIRPTSRSAKC